MSFDATWLVRSGLSGVPDVNDIGFFMSRGKIVTVSTKDGLKLPTRAPTPEEVAIHMNLIHLHHAAEANVYHHAAEANVYHLVATTTPSSQSSALLLPSPLGVIVDAASIMKAALQDRLDEPEWSILSPELRTAAIHLKKAFVAVANNNNKIARSSGYGTSMAILMANLQHKPYVYQPGSLFFFF